MAEAELFTYHDENSCSVCLDPLTDPVSLHCGHNFCLKCLTNLWDQSQVCSCPECGESFPTRPVLHINTHLLQVADSGRSRFCLPDHWEQNQEFSCPQCREIFTTRPELHINTELNEDIKKIKKTPIGPPPSQNYAGPGDTCLTCMASFCQIHLKPHFERAALKGHKLSDPDGNLQEKLCVIHQKCLEIFCKTDEMCICVMCVMTRHKGHEVVELKTKREEKKQVISHLQRIE
uniref:Uncharacterized protein n=1 Tax=Erpetoichthys calabaricus TaxID=27687 RepID=A0A8C4TLY3_ERPCA